MKVIIEVEERQYQTSEPDPDDSWDRGTTATEITNVRAVEAEEEYASYRTVIADLPVESGDTVYAVIVRYSTGDTFGNDTGQYRVMDVFATEDEAQELSKAVLDQTRNAHNDRLVPYELTHNDKTYYTDWFGYFEQFESVGVHCVKVNGGGVTYW